MIDVFLRMVIHSQKKGLLWPHVNFDLSYKSSDSDENRSAYLRIDHLKTVKGEWPPAEGYTVAAWICIESFNISNPSDTNGRIGSIMHLLSLTSDDRSVILVGSTFDVHQYDHTSPFPHFCKFNVHCNVHVLMCTQYTHECNSKYMQAHKYA